MANSILNFIYMATVVLLSTTASAQDECSPTRCNSTGPEIRFPFFLKGRQPDSCGFPGFALSCSAAGATEFEVQYPIMASGSGANIVIPFRVKVEILEIDYKSQLITMNSITSLSCLPRQIPAVNSSASPFSVVSNYGYSGYTLFNCTASSNGTVSDTVNGYPVPCLNSSTGYEVIAFDSQRDISEFILSSCAKMYSVSYVPIGVFSGGERFEAGYSYIHLNWSEPICGHCEVIGKYCRPKINGTIGETECIDSPIQAVKKSPVKKAVVAGVTVAAIVVLGILVALCVMLFRRERKKKEQKKIERFLEDYKDLRPIRFSYADIKKITDQFKHKLGRGGYGTVFKGKLSEDILVAVKVLNNSKGDGQEFINEVGTIGKIHHINVVRLVGYCADGYRRGLVYEFLPNDTLEKVISPGKQGKPVLGWEKMRQIAVGIAKGLDYLHQGCNQTILHFDIKPQNILLDHNYNPKVADFGLAKLCSKEQSVVVMTAARGTIGYIAPEVFSRNYGNVSYKSDVYSFGMLLLDMVGGRKNFHAGGAGDSSQIYYPEWMYNQLEKREDIAIQIEEEGDRNIFKKMAIVGLWCIQWYPADRPSMKAVIQMLEGDNLPMIPPNPFSSSSGGNVNANTPSSNGSFLSSEIDSIVEASDS